MVLVALVLGLVLLGVYVQVERQRRARYEERLRLWAYAEGVRFMESPGEVAALAPTQAMGAGSEGETPRFLALYSIQNQLLFLMDSCHGVLRLDAEWLERIRSQGTGSGNVGDLEWAARRVWRLANARSSGCSRTAPYAHYANGSGYDAGRRKRAHLQRRLASGVGRACMPSKQRTCASPEFSW